MMKKYSQDLVQNLANVECIGETCDIVVKLRNYIDSLPYLSKIFVIPSELQHFMKKNLYDQKKINLIEQSHEDNPKITYISSKEQLI